MKVGSPLYHLVIRCLRLPGPFHHTSSGATKRLEQLEQPLKANPLRLWEGVRVSGREITHDERVKQLPQFAVGVVPYVAGWRGDVDTDSR